VNVYQQERNDLYRELRREERELLAQEERELLAQEERELLEEDARLEDSTVLEEVCLYTRILLDAAERRNLKTPFEIQHIIAVSPSQSYELHRETGEFEEGKYRSFPSDKPWHESLSDRRFRAGDKVTAILTDGDGAVLRDEYELKEF
jgi:hypothetical protein